MHSYEGFVYQKRYILGNLFCEPDMHKGNFRLWILYPNSSYVYVMLKCWYYVIFVLCYYFVAKSIILLIIFLVLSFVPWENHEYQTTYSYDIDNKADKHFTSVQWKKLTTESKVEYGCLCSLLPTRWLFQTGLFLFLNISKSHWATNKHYSLKYAGIHRILSGTRVR